MKEMDLDPSLAFTIVLELRPGIGGKAAADLRSRLLDAWYAQEEITNMWDFGRTWLAAQNGENLVQEYIGMLRNIKAMKANVRALEGDALAVRTMLRDLGTTEEVISGYEKQTEEPS